jgi:ABC-type sugar transport system substrate-binding protein
VQHVVRITEKALRLNDLWDVQQGGFKGLDTIAVSLGGILTTIQNGAVSPFLGSGWEFTALAAIVVGGVSLLGGRGTIFFSVLPGVFIFEMIRNGLTNLVANPYSYRQYTTIVQVPTNWNPELFLSGLTNALNAHPEANCVFAASDFAFPSIQAAREKAGRWAPTGQPKHMWLATCDLLTAAVMPMEEGYVDVSTTWDAYLQAKEAVRVIIAIAKRQDPGCGPDGCLAKGRVVTPATGKTIANLWSRDYAK